MNRQDLGIFVPVSDDPFFMECLNGNIVDLRVTKTDELLETYKATLVKLQCLMLSNIITSLRTILQFLRATSTLKYNNINLDSQLLCLLYHLLSHCHYEFVAVDDISL